MVLSYKKRPFGIIFCSYYNVRTEEFDISLNALKDVVTLSTHDSIYVTSGMTTDPAERHEDDPVRRIFGNLGRPGLTLLTMPSTSNLKTSDPTRPSGDQLTIPTSTEGWRITLAAHPFTYPTPTSFSCRCGDPRLQDLVGQFS